MFLAVDIGNSFTKFGLFEGDKLTSKFSIPTKRDATAAEIRKAVGDRMPSSIDSAIACSVVPDIESAMLSFLNGVSGVKPVLVDNTYDFGLEINYEPLDSLGTDRLVSAFAAVEKYGAPCVVCSLGTATTIDVVSADREFLGGIIAPGMDAMAEALHAKAPRLPMIEIVKPENILGNSTAGSIGSGIYYGYVAMVEGLITRTRTESGVSKVVGTGGTAAQAADEFSGLMIVDESLLLDGLRLLGSGKK